MLAEFPNIEVVVSRSRVLMEDRHGLKVIETPEGEIVKFFRRKRLLSSALWDPYARRFARNAGKLRELGIPTVEVTGVWKVGSMKKEAVVYRRMEGEMFRDLEKTPERMERLAKFFAKLHEKGVFFRSVHFGNILELPDGELGLIDVADMKCKGRRLGVKERLRNFAHLVKYEVDGKAVEEYGRERFLKVYEKAAGLAGWRAEAMVRSRLLTTSG